RSPRGAGVHSVLSIPLFAGPPSHRTGQRAPPSDELSVATARATLEVSTESGDEQGCSCPLGAFVKTGVARGRKQPQQRFALTSGPVESRNDWAGVFLH